MCCWHEFENCCEQTLVLLFVPRCLKHCMVAAPVSCAWTFHMPCRENSPAQCVAISPYSTSTYFYRYCWHEFNKLLWTNILLFVPQLFHILYSTPYSAGTYLYMCRWHKFDKLCWANSDPVVCSTVVSNTVLNSVLDQRVLVWQSVVNNSDPVVCSTVVSHAVRRQFPCLVHGHLLWLHNHRHGCCRQKCQTLGTWFWWSEEIALCTRWQVSKDLYTSFFSFFPFTQDAFVFSSVEIEQ